MRIAYTVQTTSSEANVAIDCPACGTAGAPSVAHETIERVKVLGLLPILKLKSTWVECGQCHKTSVSDAGMEQLRGATPSEIAPFLRYHPSTVAKVLSVVGLLTSIIPLLGLIVAAAATYIGRGTKGWPAKLNIASLIMASAVTVTVAVFLFMH